MSIYSGLWAAALWPSKAPQTPYAVFSWDFLLLYAPHIFPKAIAQHLTKIKKYVII
jgi:hypothetical protein